MNWTKKRVGILLVVLALGSLFLFPSLPLIVVGWLSGDITYRGLPARYWREEIRRYVERWDNLNPRRMDWLDQVRVWLRLRPTFPYHPFPDAFSPRADERVLPLLFLWFSDDNDRIKEEAFRSLEYFPNSSKAVEALIRTLDNSRRDVAAMLGRMGAKAALPKLKTLLCQGPMEVQIESALAIWRIEKNADFVMPIFRDGLAQPQLNVKFQTLWSLSQLGLDASELYLEVREYAHAGNSDDLRCAAIKVIVKLGEPALEDLVRAVHDPYVDIRIDAIRALGDLPLEPFMATPVLMQGLLDSSRSVREEALQAMWKLGIDGPWLEIVVEMEKRNPP
jgi:HEAT repeats